MPVNNRWPSSSPAQTDPMRANFIGTSGAKPSALTRSNTASERIITKRERAFRSAPDLAARPRLRLTRPEIAIHEFGRHRHHDQSKNPAHHTTGSKLAPRGAVQEARHGQRLRPLQPRKRFHLTRWHRPLANGAQGCGRRRWIEPKGRNKRARVSQIVRSCAHAHGGAHGQLSCGESADG